MTDERIYIGSVETPTLAFDNRSIESIICNNSVNLIGDELGSDTLEVSVFYDDTDGIIPTIGYGTPVYYYSDNTLIGKYYVSKIDRQGVKRYLIRSTSLIGIIEREKFYGGFYTGDEFEDVVTDILLTDGIDLTKYNLYGKAESVKVGNNYPKGVKVLFKEASEDIWKYKMHIQFVFSDAYVSNTSAEIAGTNHDNRAYLVSIQASSTKRLTIMLYYKSDFNPVLTLSSDKIGIGSTITVDVDPNAQTACIAADYINPDDPTDTGHLEESTTSLPLFTDGGAYEMNYAYGKSTKSSVIPTYRFNLKWNEFKIWDENGTLLIDPVLAVRSDEAKTYVLNRYNGYAAETTSFVPYGAQIGTVGDFARFQRDLELINSIVYGDGVDGIQVRGWIPTGSKREALHFLLFAENVSLLKSETGQYIFTVLTNNTSGSIDDDRMYDDSSEETMSVAKKIDITENTYEETGTTEVLFDNTSGTQIEGEYVALFDNAPIYGTPVGNGITILHSNCNAAIVTGRGTISGTPYKHSENVIRHENPNVSDGADVSVSGIGLITSLNSDNVMNKLKAYYSGETKKITNGIVYNGERCGVKYNFKTLYSNNNNAFLTRINARTSSFVKANCDFVAGYVAPTITGYTDYAIKTYGETWEVPDAVHSEEYPTIRLNIIGKGHDGTAGTNGAPGSYSQTGTGMYKQAGAGGAGGSAGAAGAGGDIYSLTIDATDVYTIEVSSNSLNTVVKTYDDNNTILNTYSSASGNPADTGFMNIFTGTYYARKGLDGVNGAPGGAGGYGGKRELFYTDYFAPEPGGDVGTYVGGTSFRWEVKNDYGTGEYLYNSYGGGGGAAYGANGENSTRDSQSGIIVYTTGGAGANASVYQNVYNEYGSGGFGGNGGGGGGGAGTRFSWFNDGSESDEGRTYSQTPGAGGTGSAGTAGINGCVIIYY